MPEFRTPIAHADTCQFRDCAPDDHGDYCLREVGRTITARTPDGQKAEITVAVASAVPGPGLAAQQVRDLYRHHTGVVQVRVFLPDGTDLVLDVAPGEARSLQRVVDAAADIADGVAVGR